ncbi:MAG: NAD-dependent epimerase/dehydratase family protein [Stellaceae bacterium]
MAHFLVTGGAGFIGSHLVEALIADGHVVRVLDDLSSGRTENLPRGVELLTADVTDEQAVGRALDDVDGCFHLAAIASVEHCQHKWLRSHKVNLAGTITVFEAACRAQEALGRPLPVVYASSAAVYGNTSEIPITEGAPTRPVNAYGIDKLGCELHAAVASRIHKLHSVGLRFFNVYGPRQDPHSPYSGVISVFCQRILRGAPLEIHGDGNQVRDFVYVRDAVNALRLAIDAATIAPQVYNVCTGVQTKICQLGAIIGQMQGVHFSPRYTPERAGDSRVSVGDPRKARDMLKFSAVTSLQEGLEQTIEAMMPCQTKAGAPDHLVATTGD